MPLGNRFRYPNGKPTYFDEGKDRLEFAIGSGKDLDAGVSFRKIDRQDQWQLATAIFKKGGPLVVSDARGKDGIYKTWRVEPSSEPDLGQGIILHPLHEGGSFFRGSKAFATEPLILSTSMKSLIAHIAGNETFNRVSTAAGIGKGWGDVSRDMSLIHNYGFVRATGVPTVYDAGSPEVLALKSEKDREHGPGAKMNYEKTETWPKLLAQFEAMLDDRKNRVEVEL